MLWALLTARDKTYGCGVALLIRETLMRCDELRWAMREGRLMSEEKMVWWSCLDKWLWMPRWMVGG